MSSDYLISLDNVADLEAAKKGGGKFLGLYKAQKLLKECINSEIDVAIPKTFVLTTDAFKKVDMDGAKADVPEDLVHLAMQALVKSGGKVAVRSSADIEDEGGKTHSGEFKSFLNIKNQSQMREALQKIYTSANNVDNAQMAVMIQEMVEKPLLAGVAYSRDLNGDDKVVINYVENKTAERMIIGREEGQILKLDKNIYTDKGLEVLVPENFSKSNEADAFKILKENGDSNDFEAYFPTYALMQVAALNNKLVKEFGYSIDMEFAVGKNAKNEPKLYLLQQRPYIAADNFKIKFLPNGDKYGYNQDDGKVIEGEALLWDELFVDKKQDPRYIADEVMKDKIVIMNYRKSREDFETDWEFVLYRRNSYSGALRAMWNEKHIKAKALIDRFGMTRQLMHGHWGNQLQEKGMPFYMRNSESADYVEGQGFEDLKSGDRIRVNLADCSYQILSRKNELKHAPLKPVVSKFPDISELKYRGK